ncbi:MAG: PTS sugar transporter subunit IIB [Erysipelotrichaceae bacterium]|jgi:fructoselysine and glucoselysine-specific PTS system IIB component|nr:PTS sugar transporter subunit IIB [Erysipelotrichaceae bacterium]
MIRFVRIDHRLLHGQVAFAWTKNLGADCILIANDRVANDELASAVLRIAKPSGIKLVIKSVEDSITALNSGATDKYKLFIIVGSIADAKKLSDKVDAIKSINLGGVKKEEGKKQISRAVFVSDEEIALLKQMNAKGIELEIRMIPDDTAVDAIKVI